jgi:hypothetical protein
MRAHILDFVIYSCIRMVFESALEEKKEEIYAIGLAVLPFFKYC